MPKCAINAFSTFDEEFIMGWRDLFSSSSSSSEDYDTSGSNKISYERGDERVKTSFDGETQYGSHNRPSQGYEQGDRHETHWSADGSRTSVDIDSDGNPIESTRHSN
jgi:hypothetical protein